MGDPDRAPDRRWVDVNEREALGQRVHALVALAGGQA